MSSDRDVTTRIVRSWLHEDAYEDADRILNLVIDEIDTTPQRRAVWLARRFPPMNSNSVRVALVAAAAVVVVAAIIGFSYLDSQVGSDEPTPSPSPIVLDASYVGKPLDGRYAVTVGTGGRQFDLELTVRGSSLVRLSPAEASLSANRGGDPGSAPYAYRLDLAFFSVGGVYKDPCHPEEGTAGSYFGPSNSNDLERELTSLPGFTHGPVIDEIVGGLAARRFELSNTIDTATAGCTDGDLLPLFQTMEYGGSTGLDVRQQHSPAANGGTTQHIWIVDRSLFPLLIVGEVQRTGGVDPGLVTSSPPDFAGAGFIELEAIVSSIAFQ